ncbi:hypothetical protein PIB30_092140, partial [Stylosanthes scabra]|nr:hypothetical protein [Stylosanthes scabra]
MCFGLVRPDQTLFEPDWSDPIRYRASVARISLLHPAVSSSFHQRLASFRHVLASSSNATQSSFLHSSLHDNNSITDIISPSSFICFTSKSRTVGLSFLLLLHDFLFIHVLCTSYVQNCGLFTYTFDYHRLISHHLQNLNNTPWASSPSLTNISGRTSTNTCRAQDHQIWTPHPQNCFRHRNGCKRSPIRVPKLRRVAAPQRHSFLQASDQGPIIYAETRARSGDENTLCHTFCLRQLQTLAHFLFSSVVLKICDTGPTSPALARKRLGTLSARVAGFYSPIEKQIETKAIKQKKRRKERKKERMKEELWGHRCLAKRRRRWQPQGRE